jgi:hypothetical protein
LNFNALVANFSSISSKTPDSYSASLQSRIVGTVEGRVRQLKGYQKCHHLPDGHHPAAQTFVRKVGHENVKELIDLLYTDIRSLFGYKRREFEYTCEDGFGYIKSPDFDLQVYINQSHRDRKKYQLTTEIVAIHTAAITADPRFHSCFTHHCDRLIVDLPCPININDKIDTIEELPEIANYLSYEPDGSSFELKLIPLDLEIRITESDMTFQLLTLRDLKKLLRHSQQALDLLTAVSLVQGIQTQA